MFSLNAPTGRSWMKVIFPALRFSNSLCTTVSIQQRPSCASAGAATKTPRKSVRGSRDWNMSVRVDYCRRGGTAHRGQRQSVCRVPADVAVRLYVFVTLRYVWSVLSTKISGVCHCVDGLCPYVRTDAARVRKATACGSLLASAL